MKKPSNDGSVPFSARFRPPQSKRLDFIPGKMIVKIRENALSTAAGTLKGGGAKLAMRVEKDIPESIGGPLDYLRNNAGLKFSSAVFVDKAARKVPGLGSARLAALSSVADSPHEDLRGYTVVDVDPAKVNTRTLKTLNASRAIEFAEPMPARWLSKAPSAAATDPLLSLQWALKAIGWTPARKPTALQSKRIRIAVLDTGLDTTHEDMRHTTVHYDHKDNSATDVLGHGTHVAGIIRAVANNHIGIRGVSQCPLAIWKIFDDTPSHGDFYVNGENYLRALGLLADFGCKVVNLSIGGTQQSQAEALLFRRLRQRNILPIAAMGNEFDEGNPIEFPAAYPGVIGVGAVSSELRRASFSNTGAHIWLCAPGDNIVSTLPMLPSPFRDEFRYAPWSGTSMATPHVAAAAAMYWAKRPTATANQVEAALARGVKKLPQMKNAAFTRELGHGLLYLPKLL